MDVVSGRGKKVAIGKNSTIKQYNLPSLHAEIDAYHKLSNYYASQELDMFVVRFSNDGKLCESRPCYNCLRTLYGTNIRIKNVYYSTKGHIVKEKFSNMLESNLTKLTSATRRKLRLQLQL